MCLDPEATHCIGAATRIDGGQQATGTEASQPTLPDTDADAVTSRLPRARSLDPAVLERLLSQGALGPIRGELDDRCILNEGEHQVSPVGQISPDGKHCVIERDVNVIKNGRKLRTKVQRVPIQIGQPVYRDPATGRLCLSRNTRSKRDCPVVLDAEHNRPLSSGTEAGYHAAIGLVDWTKGKADTAKSAAHLLTHPAELTTAGLKAAERAEQAAKSAAATLKDPNKAQQAAYDAWNGTVDAAHAKWQAAVHWYDLPTQKKIDSAAETGVKGALDVGTTVVVGAVIPGGGTGVTIAEEVEKDAAKGAARLLEKKAGQAAGTTEVKAGAGAAGGERAGKPFTRAGKREIKAENAAAHEGQTTCVGCDRPTVPAQQSRRGVTPPGNETNVDHIISQSKGGNGSLDNGQVLCRDCNLKKGAD